MKISTHSVPREREGNGMELTAIVVNAHEKKALVADHDEVLKLPSADGGNLASDLPQVPLTLRLSQDVTDLQSSGDLSDPELGCWYLGTQAKSLTSHGYDGEPCTLGGPADCLSFVCLLSSMCKLGRLLGVNGGAYEHGRGGRERCRDDGTMEDGFILAR